MKDKLDQYERDILAAYEQGELKSIVTTVSDLEKYRHVARETLLKNRRVNIRLSNADLMDIQERALEEGIPYQTLIASILHKYISGRLVESPSRLATRASGTIKKQRETDEPPA